MIAHSEKQAAAIGQNNLSTRQNTSHLASLPLRSGRKAKNAVMAGVISLAFLLALVPLISLLWEVVKNGLARLNWSFLSTTMQSADAALPGTPTGGIAHAIIGTLWVTLIASAISVPIGLMCAIYLTEYSDNGRLARAIRFFVDVMTGIPSIVAGLFAYALFAILIGPAYLTGLVGAVALSVLMTPIVVRSSEEMLSLVPHDLREAALALGVPKWLVTLNVVVRTAAPGIITGIMLAVARIIGETAPLLLTTGINDYMNANPLNGQMSTLPRYIYDQWHANLATCPPHATRVCIPELPIQRAWSAALVLILIVMIISLAARFVAARFSHKKARS